MPPPPRSRRALAGRGSTCCYRFTDLPLDQYPLLGWDWFVEQPIASEADEITKAGDDHPARLYRKHWGDPRGTNLQEVALFCDTDATGAQSVAYFSAVRVERAP